MTGSLVGIGLQLTIPIMGLFAALFAWGAYAGDDIHSVADEPDAWIFVSYVLVAAMAATYIASGWVASRIMASVVGWWVLIVPILVWATFMNR